MDDPHSNFAFCCQDLVSWLLAFAKEKPFHRLVDMTWMQPEMYTRSLVHVSKWTRHRLDQSGAINRATKGRAEGSSLQREPCVGHRVTRVHERQLLLRSLLHLSSDMIGRVQWSFRVLGQPCWATTHEATRPIPAPGRQKMVIEAPYFIVRYYYESLPTSENISAAQRTY